MWRPCAWLTKNWRSTGRWRKRSFRTWRARRGSRPSAWAWASDTGGNTAPPTGHTNISELFTSEELINYFETCSELGTVSGLQSVSCRPEEETLWIVSCWARVSPADPRRRHSGSCPAEPEQTTWRIESACGRCSCHAKLKKLKELKYLMRTKTLTTRRWDLRAFDDKSQVGICWKLKHLISAADFIGYVLHRTPPPPHLNMSPCALHVWKTNSGESLGPIVQTLSWVHVFSRATQVSLQIIKSCSVASWNRASLNVPYSCFSAVSHSVMSEMQVIEQETPVGAKSSSRSKLDMFDEPGFTSGPPK